MTYLVEYKMLRAGKVICEGVAEVEAHDEYYAKQGVRDNLLKLNKEAEIQICDVVSV